MSASLRVAIGPFPASGWDDWPLVGSESLAPEFEILRFASGDLPPEADALVVWSPEYHPVPGLADYPGYRVACYGDWHIVPFESTRLSLLDLVATDLRGTRRLAALGYPASPVARPQVLWFRMFSFDPRLHTLPVASEPRDIDLAFMGRPDGGPRDAWLRRVGELALGRWHAYLCTEPFPRGVEANIYQRARLVLNRSARGELNMRTYEAAACGALVLVEQENAEVYAAGAPIPTYQDAHLEQTLAAWLDDPAALAAAAAHQHEWVQRERPVDHLGWLCRQIRERLPTPTPDPSPLSHQERHPRVWLPRQQTDSTPAPPPAAPQRTSGQNNAAALAAEHTSGAAGQPDHPPRDVAAEVAALPVVEAPTVDEQRREVVALLLSQQPAMRTVLDVGCGRGGLGWWLRQQLPGVTVTGIDCDPAALQIAESRLARASLQHLDAPVWPPGGWAAPRQYDAIVCADILEHLIFPQRCLARLRPLLRKDGVLISSIPNLRNAGVLFDLAVRGRFPYHKPGQTPFEGPPSNLRCEGHLRFFCWSDLEVLFAEAGYTIVRDATQCTLMAAPGLARFVEDVGHLVQIHGGDREAWGRESLVMQFLVVARPNWQAVAAEG